MSELDEEEFFAGLEEPDTRSTRKQFADEIKRGEVVAVQDESEEEQALRERGGRAIRPVEVEDGRQTLFMRTPESLPGAAAREADTAARVQRDIRGTTMGGVNPGAVALGASDALTFGHTDELAGALGAAAGQGYERTRDRARSLQEAVRTEHPGSNVAGVALGIGAGLPLLPAAAGRAATGLGRVGMAGLEGLGYGAVGGAGASEADVGSQEFAQDVGLTGALGGVAGGALGGIGEGVRGVLGQSASRLRDSAALRRARQVFGGDAPTTSRMRQFVGPQGAGRPERVRGRLSRLRELGLESADDAPRIQEEVGSRMSEVADQIDDAIGQTADVAGPLRSGQTRGVSGDEIADRILSRADELQTSRGVSRGILSDMAQEAERWREGASQGPMPFRQAWEWRRQMNDPAHWSVGASGNLPRNSAHRRELTQIVNDVMEDSAEQAAPGLGREFRQASRDYSVVAPMAEAADDSALRAARNRQVSLSDYIGAGIGSGLGAGAGLLGDGNQSKLGAAVGLAAGVLGNRALRGREHRLVGSGMETLARVIERQPQRLGQYGTVLQQAMQRGPGAYAATFFTMSQNDPAFRQAVTRAEDDLENPDAADEEPDEAQYMSEEDFFEGFEE